MPLLVFSADLLAASLVETKREEGGDVMYVDGYRMMINSPDADFRMIMDLGQKKAFMINPKNKTVMDMSEATWKALKEAGEQKAPPKVDARLEKVGSGPEIAGYDTTHYKIYADGHVCAEKWTSRKALEDSGFDEIWDKYGEFLVSASIDGDSHPCELAEYQVFRDDKYGMALKEIDHNCETNEVLRIERNAQVNRSDFELPADYKVLKLPAYSGSMTQGHLQEDGTWSWGQWEGMDCSEKRDEYAGMGGDFMDDEYFDEEYADEEYADEDYVDEEYAEEDFDEEVEDLGEEIKGKFKGFMNKFKKKDKDQEKDEDR
jgi:hypothetical protein